MLYFVPTASCCGTVLSLEVLFMVCAVGTFCPILLRIARGSCSLTSLVTENRFTCLMTSGPNKDLQKYQKSALSWFDQTTNHWSFRSLGFCWGWILQLRFQAERTGILRAWKPQTGRWVGATQPISQSVLSRNIFKCVCVLLLEKQNSPGAGIELLGSS